MLHVHAYEEHDHPDHHHGPAAHSHEKAAHHQHREESSPAKDGGTRVEPCDPGEHAIPVVFTCVSPTSHQISLDVTAVGVLLTPPVLVPCRVTPSDVRAHSPPCLTDAPLRAPPVVHPA